MAQCACSPTLRLPARHANMAEIEQLAMVYGDAFEDPGLSEDRSDVGDVDAGLISDALVSATDWTAETILSQIDKGNILLNPAFQRRDAWDIKRKSAFIESIILNIPIPQIVLAEAKSQKGKFIVLDGKQRLLTMRQFAADDTDPSYRQIKLADLDILKGLNGLSLSDLRLNAVYADELAEFENRSIRTVVVRNWQSEDFLYQVFLRLNTGSVSLSPQELRQALHPGKFIDFVDKRSGESLALRQILNNPEPDFRMRDVELMIRYLAYRNFLDKYAGNMKKFLDEACNDLNRSWSSRSEEILSQSDEFEDICAVVRTVFGDNAFKKWVNGAYESRFNRAVFDVMTYSLNDPVIRAVVSGNSMETKSAFQELCSSDPSFLSALEQTTKSLSATCYRLAAWARAINKAFGTRAHVPVIESGRIK